MLRKGYKHERIELTKGKVSGAVEKHYPENPIVLRQNCRPLAAYAKASRSFHLQIDIA